MKRLVKIIFLSASTIFLFYLFLPGPDFPEPPPDAIRSMEPADTETPLRRAYFTDFTRQEVLSHYQEQLETTSFMNLPLPTYRLNYPPENAQTIIRDQTRSTFLEEIVHPFRESLFVNGFEPTREKDAIFIEGKNWRQKITVRYVPSSLWARVGVGALTLALIVFIYKDWRGAVINLRAKLIDKWISL